jgi:molecular chaperone HscB
VKCWNCQAESTAADLCPRCGKVQPLPVEGTLFQAVGLPRGVDVDVGQLERNYRERSLLFHPDRVGKEDPRERRMALERTAQLNEAYRTLKSPESRAFYLLKLQGVDLRRDEMRGAAVPAELLEQVLELREQLEDAHSRGDEETVSALSDRVRTQSATALSAAQSALRRLEQDPADAEARAEATHALARLRYHHRFLEAVDAGGEEEI